MTAQLLMSQDQVAADRDGWLKARHALITASDVPAILGLAPKSWKRSAFSVYREKTDPEPPGDDDDEILELGRYMEGWVAQRFARRHPELWVTEGGLYADADRPWLGCTFDRLAFEHSAVSPAEVAWPPQVVQCKTAGWRNPLHWGPPGTAHIPRYYRPQCLIELHVAGAERVWVPTMFHDTREVAVYLLTRDADAQDDIDWILGELDSFRARVEARNEPDIDWSAGTAEAITRRFGGQVDDRNVEVPWGLARRYRRAVAGADRAEERLGLAANLLRERLGTGRRAVDKDGVSLAVRSVSAPKRIDAGRLREEQPEIAARYTKAGKQIDKIVPSRGAWD